MADRAVQPAAHGGIDVEQEIWRITPVSLARMLETLGVSDVDLGPIVSALTREITGVRESDARCSVEPVSVPAGRGRELYNGTALVAALAFMGVSGTSLPDLVGVVVQRFDLEHVVVDSSRMRLCAALRQGIDSDDWFRRLAEASDADRPNSPIESLFRQCELFADSAELSVELPPSRPSMAVPLPAPKAVAADPPTVFISYAHDSPFHKTQVALLAELLHDGGVRVILDQWAQPRRKDWSTWAPRAIVRSDFTVMVASPDYKRAADDFDDSPRNPGVQSEAAVIRDLLHGDRPRWKKKLLPVLLPGHDKDEIPYFMQPNSADWYRIDVLEAAGIADLLATVTAGTEGTAEESQARAAADCTTGSASLPPPQSSGVTVAMTATNSGDGKIFQAGRDQHITEA